MQAFPKWNLEIVLREKPLFESDLSDISPSEAP